MKLPLSTRAATVILAVVAAVALAWAASIWHRKSRPAVTVGPVATRPAADAGVQAVAVGGPFALVAHSGETVSEATYRGSFMLVFFGYTFCPDVCPTELLVMSRALDLLGDKAEAVQPLFVTVDPERDTAAVLADYVVNFHPRLVGLTGSPAQIAAVAEAYRAYYAKAPLPPSGGSEDAGDGKTAGAKTEDYLMDHSAFVYLMGPDGEYRGVFPPGTPPEAMAEAIAAALAQPRPAEGG